MLRLLQRRLFGLCLLLFLLTNFTACRGTTVGPDGLTQAQRAWVEQQMQTLTPAQKVSQLISVQAFGHFTSTHDPAYRTLVDQVERLQVGGVIFFQGDPLSQAVLANDLQSRAGVPLLMSQDMEWGPGMRLTRTTTLPRTMALGATADTALARAAGYVTAREARALGVHQVYAPVADVNNNPRNPVINVRSFGEDPAQVGALVAAFARGVAAGGAIATVKHFPGHGDTATDSHLDLPVLPFTRARLDSLELIPFRAAIDAGVGSVMVAHLALPELEPDTNVPATLSPSIGRLLRDDLGFDGLVVTDALRMQGVTKHFGVGEAAIRAIEAGADALLLSDDPEAARAAVLRALEGGRLSPERIDASVRRLLGTKARLGLHRQRLVDLSQAARLVNTRPHRVLSETIARASLTLLRNDGDRLPLLDAPDRLLVLTLSDGTDAAAGRTFLANLRRQGTGTAFAHRLLDRRSSPADYAAALTAAARYDLVVVPAFVRVRTGTGEINLLEAHRTFLNELIAQGTEVVLIAFGNPYIVRDLPQEPTAYVAAYGGSEASQQAMAEALFGKAGFEGRLPVAIPGRYALGAGIPVLQAAPRTGAPEEVGLDGDVLARIDSVLQRAVDDRAFPGAAVAVGRGQVLAKLDGYGYYTYASEHRVTPRSRFDLASLTKVVATTTAAMQLFEQGRLDLDAPVVRYLPAFGANGKDAITIRHLLTHTSGMIPFRPFHTMGFTDREAVLDFIQRDSLVFTPGTESRYSDFNMIMLARVIEEITGQDFATYSRRAIFEPLGMTRTGFRRAGFGSDTTIVPTEVDAGFRKRLVQGEVHDETAYLLGGTAGHAGLFSTAEDLATFAHMLVNDGRVGGRVFLRPETIRRFTTAVDPTRTHTRALGWDTKAPEGYSSAGQRFGLRSFGHTGFTGTSLWIDPDTGLFVILLTNRVYPTRDNRGHIPIRPLVADLAHEALVGPPGPLLPGQPPPRSGITRAN